jgi:hypothetical protein
MRRDRLPWPTAFLLLCCAVPALAADDAQTEAKQNQDVRLSPEEQAEAVELERRGAGFRVGFWDLNDLEEVEGAEYSQSPAFEAYFQKGLDAHLVIESALGLLKRSQSIEQSGSFGSSSTEHITSYVLPAFSAIRVYPFTRPKARFEPFADAGVGFALGIDDRELTSDGLLEAGTDSGTSFVMGFGFKTGSGFEWMFSRAFGLNLDGHYQWIRFSEELGGERTFKGFGLNSGLVYRFQY